MRESSYHLLVVNVIGIIHLHIKRSDLCPDHVIIIRKRK